jgi:hypothetical protein
MLNRVAKPCKENEEKTKTIWNKEVMASGGNIYIYIYIYITVLHGSSVPKRNFHFFLFLGQDKFVLFLNSGLVSLPPTLSFHFHPYTTCPPHFHWPLNQMLLTPHKKKKKESFHLSVKPSASLFIYFLSFFP